VLNRLLGFKGTVVDGVDFADGVMLIQLRVRSKVLVCPCGRTSKARYDRSRRRWRHVDFGRWRVVIEAEIRRIDCRSCQRVRTEWMPWARPGARHTRDFEDLAGWLVRKMSKAAMAALLGTTWETVDALVRRLVTEHLDTRRLDGIYRIGVDEIAYRKGRKFLTVVADHDTGKVVFVGEGRTQHVFGEFLQSLGEHGRQRIEAVSMDMTPIYRKATIAHVPHAAICLDPFHVIKWASEPSTWPTKEPLTWPHPSPSMGSHTPRAGRKSAALYACRPRNTTRNGPRSSNNSAANTPACTAPGPSKKPCAISTASPPTKPPITYAAGSNGPCAATSTPSSPSPGGYATTTTASSTPSACRYQTRCWNPSTPAST
jgi:hypothetical protein